MGGIFRISHGGDIQNITWGGYLEYHMGGIFRISHGGIFRISHGVDI